MHEVSRRHLLGIGAAGLAVAAGCLGSGSGTTEPVDLEPPEPYADPLDDVRFDTTPDSTGRPPVSDRRLHRDYDRDVLLEEMISGGVPQDGIPAIDEPSFVSADDASGQLEGRSPVFGVVIDGTARAYPQYILVSHEIVNDEIEGVPVAVTYCPLTGTAQGFFRGDTTFGVSGQLINSNLVMFDRAGEDYWPQMLAVSIDGDHVGQHLGEFQAIWTTWLRWRTQYPDTTVLTEDTGFARNYGRDPYGSYTPLTGYYANHDDILFSPLASDNRFRRKDVVIGARTADGAFCVEKDHLREATVVAGTTGGTDYVTVYDPVLDTGFAYVTDDHEVVDDDGTVTVDGDPSDPPSLPLPRVIAYDAFWFAWYGYYPSTDVHE